jgi:hypothetical protein
VAQLSTLGHFTMRYTIPILFIAATFLVGCHSPLAVETQPSSPTVAAPPPVQPMLITSLGTMSDGRWKISVSEAALDLSRPGCSIGVPRWTARTGWFVFIESDSRVWAYDGDHPLWLSTVMRSGNGVIWTNYVSPRFPCAVPSVVFSHLSETAQKDIQSHD